MFLLRLVYLQGTSYTYTGNTGSFKKQPRKRTKQADYVVAAAAPVPSVGASGDVESDYAVEAKTLEEEKNENDDADFVTKESKRRKRTGLGKIVGNKAKSRKFD